MVRSSVSSVGAIRRVLLSGCASLALAAGAAGTALASADAAVEELGETRNFNVSPQPLQSALNQWSITTGKDWGHIGSGLKEVKTRGVRGRHTDHVALRRILADTGYTFNVVSSGGVSIVRVQADAPAAAPAPERVAETPSERQLDTIVVRGVTAQRREQDLQDVPIAVTAFGQDQLSRRQIVTTADLGRNVLNLIGANNVGLGTSVTYFMRGVGSTESIATFDLPVGTYVDEVYISRQNANQIRLSGVERVEVLRGPQGTLFGRNTTGGAVSIVSRKPRDEFGAEVEVGYGSFDRVTASGAVDLPLADGLYSRLSAFVVNEDGFVENAFNDETFNGEESWGVRGAFRLEPFERVTWDVSAQYIVTDYLQIGTPEILDPVTFAGQRRPVTGDLFTTRLTDRECEPTGDPATWAGQGCHYNSTESLLTISNLEFAFDAGTLNLITGYYDLEQRANVDFFGNTTQPVFGGGLGANFYISNLGQHSQVSQEVKWTGSLLDGRITYVSGFFFMQEDNETSFVDTVFIPAPLPLAIRDSLMNETRNIAFYTQADMELNDFLTLQAGVRWTEEDKDLELDGVAFDFATFSFVPLDSAALQAAGIPLDQNVSRWTPRVALMADITDDHMVYFSFTQGFKSGGWNARGTQAIELQPFGPEFVDSYEVGLRASWLDNRLLTNLTLFRAIYDDYQVPSTFPGSANFLTLNSGTAEVDGIEFEFAARVTETLEVFGNLGLQDGEYVELSQGAINAQIGPELQRTPEITAQFGFVQDFPLPGGHLLQLSSDVRYTDTFEVLPDNPPAATVFDRPSMNAQLSWTGPDRQWKFIAECANCANDEYFEQNFFNVLYPADPRRWGVRVQYRY